MFYKKEDEYAQATKHARVNTYVEGGSSNIKVTFINFVIVSTLGYFLFTFLKNETTLLSNFFPAKEAVLGVSERADDYGLSDEELIKLLKVTQSDEAEQGIVNKSQGDLSNSIKVLINESNIKSQSSYTKAISRELIERNGFPSRMVVVKQGDTLSSLAEKFYGNSMEYSKIIDSNPSLSANIDALKVGQSINIPY